MTFSGSAAAAGLPGQTPAFATAALGADAYASTITWDGGERDADVELFALAERRFERELRAHAAEVAECMAALRGSLAASSSTTLSPSWETIER